MTAATSFRINRRVHHRYVMVLRDGFLHVGGTRVPCVIRNISSVGLMARVYRRVDLGETVAVELASKELLAGTVLWTRDWEAGIAFAAPIDVDATLAEQWVAEGSDDRRKSRRFEVDCPATLQVRQRFYYGRLRDLSPSGARIETQGRLKKLGSALLTLPDLPPLPAKIRWTKNRQCGLSFSEHIPIEGLNRWLQERGCIPDGAAAA